MPVPDLAELLKLNQHVDRGVVQDALELHRQVAAFGLTRPTYSLGADPTAWASNEREAQAAVEASGTLASVTANAAG